MKKKASKGNKELVKELLETNGLCETRPEDPGDIRVLEQLLDEFDKKIWPQIKMLNEGVFSKLFLCFDEDGATNEGHGQRLGLSLDHAIFPVKWRKDLLLYLEEWITRLFGDAFLPILP